MIIKRIVKLGGAAITKKEDFETLDSETLRACTRQLAEVIAADLPGEKTIVVHGAGSFGHFQASASGVFRGGSDAVVTAGIAATRVSVTKLNNIVIQALIEENVLAVGLSTFGVWVTKSGPDNSNLEVVQDGCEAVKRSLSAGLVPVLHGDVVFDESIGCTILSGDAIVRRFCAVFKPEFVVFLTNVDGIFDRPPSEPEARLLEKIEVGPDGQWSDASQDGGGEVSFAAAEHDSTGGMAGKIQEAAVIAGMHVDVLIAKAGTTHALLALQHGPQIAAPETAHGLLARAKCSKWVGTLVKKL